MANTQTQFMLNTCFSYVQGEGYTPIMINMSLTRGVLTPGAAPGDDPTISQITTKFDLPILTIIPLNSLAVDAVDINFDMEVKSSYGEETNASQTETIAASTEWEAKVGYGPFSASIKGSASYDSTNQSSQGSHYEKSNSAKYTVNVHAGQLPLPMGVTTIIDAFTKSIDPIEMPAAT